MATKSKSAHTLFSSRINFTEKRSEENLRHKRRREELEVPTINLEQSESDKTITSPAKPNGDFNQRSAIKLDRLKEKEAKYESHLAFLKKCLDEKVIPKGLQIQVEPTLGNHDEEFLKIWYEKLNKYSFDLMEHIKNFCEKSKDNFTNQVKASEAELKTKTNETQFREISNALEYNQTDRKRILSQQKNKKFNRLKYNLQPNIRQGRTQRNDNESKREIRNSRSRSRTRQAYPSYAEALKTSSRTNNHSLKPEIKTSQNTTQVTLANKERQIQRLQEQIENLHNDRTGTNQNYHFPKNENSPQSGARTHQATQDEMEKKQKIS